MIGMLTKAMTMMIQVLKYDPEGETQLEVLVNFFMVVIFL